MINLSTFIKAWEILSSKERRGAFFALFIVVLGAVSSAFMVGSILPFLSVLSDPAKIEQTALLNWAFKTFGFTTVYPFLVCLGIFSFITIVVACSIQIIRTYVVESFAMMHVHSLSDRLLRSYLSKPYEFFLNRHTGEMSTLILQEVQQMTIMFLRPAAELIAATLTIITIVSLLVWLAPKITIIAFVIFGGSYLLIYLINQRLLKRHGILRANANVKRSRIINEALSGIKDIKLLGREATYADNYAEPSLRMTRSIISIQVLSQIPQYGMQAIAFGGIILLCLFLMDASVLSDGAAVGEILPLLGVFSFAGQRLLPELAKFYKSIAQMHAGSVIVDSVHGDLMKNAHAELLKADNSQALRLKRRLALVDVDYTYPNAKLPGLRGVNISVQAGERIGIIGSTGAGKTTLADLVLGLLSPTRGTFSVDGVEIIGDNVRQWQKSVAYVPQDIFLIDASVTENIALGVPAAEIDEARVRSAATIAQLDSVIQNELPNGYSTAIGERGTRLSGGQRQRVGIARALYRDVDLILFDEATSALDNLTERDVMSAIEALPGDKTIFIIAHRLSTVKCCDSLIVLDSGRVIDCGTWEHLMSNNEDFRNLALHDHEV